MLRYGCTCVDLIAFLGAHGGRVGLSSLLLLAFPSDRTEGGGVTERGESSLKNKDKGIKTELNPQTSC